MKLNAEGSAFVGKMLIFRFFFFGAVSAVSEPWVSSSSRCAGWTLPPRWASFLDFDFDPVPLASLAALEGTFLPFGGAGIISTSGVSPSSLDEAFLLPCCLADFSASVTRTSSSTVLALALVNLAASSTSFLLGEIGSPSVSAAFRPRGFDFACRDLGLGLTAGDLAREGEDPCSSETSKATSSSEVSCDDLIFCMAMGVLANYAALGSSLPYEEMRNGHAFFELRVLPSTAQLVSAPL